MGPVRNIKQIAIAVQNANYPNLDAAGIAQIDRFVNYVG